MQEQQSSNSCKSFLNRTKKNVLQFPYHLITNLISNSATYRQKTLKILWPLGTISSLWYWTLTFTLSDHNLLSFHLLCSLLSYLPSVDSHFYLSILSSSLFLQAMNPLMISLSPHLAWIPRLAILASETLILSNPCRLTIFIAPTSGNA